MCVTNTTLRRVQAVTLTPNQIGGVCPSSSALSQRLLGAFAGQQQQHEQQQQYVHQLGACNSNSSPDFLVTSAPFSHFQQQHAHEEKPRPKRRRKPQKPGKTAKMNDRHFVVHNYHDHSMDPIDGSSSSVDGSSGDYDHHHDHSDHNGDEDSRRRGGVSVAFPIKLHAVLDQVERDGFSHVISWSPHGRCFVIHKPKQFVEEVMPKYFRQSKLTSFQRQLNLYGFARLTRGPDAGGYYHELFLRNREHLCKKMTRTKVKGTKFKAASSPESEPDFYAMPPVSIVTPPHSEDEEMSFDSSQYANQVVHVQHLNTAPPAPVPLIPSSLLYATAPPTSSSSMEQQQQQMFANTLLWNRSSDQVLDDAVDELFLNELGEQDNLTDFVADWDPNNSFGSSLNDDAQLGYMLERLLED